MRILVTGSSGLIGSSLLPALTAGGHEVTRAVRRAPARTDEVSWDPNQEIDPERLKGLDAVVHLAGENIGRKWWTARNKAKIFDSRVYGSTSIAKTVASIEPPPSVLISASAIGYYGDRGDEELTEESPSGVGFRAVTCRDWEAATEPARLAGVRVVKLRTGLVLATNGGLFPYLLFPAKLGISLQFGTGKQYWSWITIRDVVRAILFLIQSADLEGAVNLTSPNPARHSEFARLLGQAVGRGVVAPLPSLSLKLLLGAERVNEVLLSSQRVLPTRLLDAGFQFVAPNLELAFQELLHRPLEVS